MDELIVQIYEVLPSAAKIKIGDKFEVAILPNKHKNSKKLSKNIIAVGDYVKITRDENNFNWIIQEIIPRKSKLSRKINEEKDLEQVIAANIDQVFIVTSVDYPEFKPMLIDRYLITAEKFNITPIILINKIDLLNDNLEKIIFKYKNIYENIGYKVLLISTLTGYGLDLLKDNLKEKISVFSGQSGVGKSTLLNTLIPGLNLRTNQVSSYHKKGVHTTTSAVLIDLPFGGKCIDTPGIKFLTLWKIEKQELKSYFIEFRKYEKYCKFNNCVHIPEISCAVKKAVEDNLISIERYENYIDIYNSL